MILFDRIENYCNDYAKVHGQTPFQLCDNQAPIASTKACFDDLRVPPDHVSRRQTDTYYVDQDTVRVAFCIYPRLCNLRGSLPTFYRFSALTLRRIKRNSCLKA